MPKHTEEFVHRIGRTGRAGSKGDAISFVGPKDWLSFKNVEGLLQQTISFDIVEGLKAKFKGLKPKKVEKVKKSSDDNDKNKGKAKSTKPFKSKSTTFHIAKEAGNMPILRKKKTLTPDEIESNDIDES
jgi:superfamily II DNA/RNA helicase